MVTSPKMSIVWIHRRHSLPPMLESIKEIEFLEVQLVINGRGYSNLIINYSDYVLHTPCVSISTIVLNFGQNVGITILDTNDYGAQTLH